MKLRVVVAEDDPDFLRVLASILRAEFEVVGTAEDASSAVCLARTHQPDVAVVDLEISGHSGFEVTKSIAATRSRTAVVVCSLEKDPEFVAAAHHAGALGYVFKSRIATDLIPAVQSVGRGHRFTSSD